MILFLHKEDIASHFCRCTGCFQTCCSTTDYNDITVLINFQLLINITFRYGRIDRTTNRTVYTDTVSRTSNVTGDTFTDHIHVSVLNFLHPVRICNQSTSHSDDIHISAFQNFFYNFRISVVTCVDNRFFEFIFYGSCHVRAPSIRQIVGIDLILKGWVQSTGYIIHIHEFIQVFQILQCIFQCISTRNTFLSRDTHNNRKPWSHIFSDFFQYHTRKTKTILYRSSEFICPLVIIWRNELTHQIGMSTVNLHCIKPDCLYTLCCFSVFFYGSQDLFLCHWTRNLTTDLRRNIGRRHSLHSGSC